VALQHDRHYGESAAERRLRLVRAYAWNGLALLTLYDGWRYFEPSDLDGFVAFELHRRTAVACGDPVCDERDLPELLRRFAEYCAARKWRFTFVGASERVGRVAASLGWRALKIGEEPFFELATYSLSGRGAKKVRSATNLARRSGITVEEYTGRSPAVDAEIEEISREWLASRKAPPMGFLLRSRPLARREHKRIFLAKQGERIVGAMTCAPAPARGLLYVEEQLRRPDAPYGTTELLVDEARRVARAEGYALLSLGTAPLQGAERQPFGRFRLMKALVRALTSKLNFVYSFRSLNHYKRKFAPTFWEDNFFVYTGSIVPAALAVASAFAPDGLPSLVLPKRLQWLRLMPAAALWTAAFGGIALTAFASYEFPILTAPVREAFEVLAMVRLPVGFTLGHTRAAVAAHRLVAAIVVLAGGGALAWQRRARA
jgi:phosphatidylglycerol lysyltransferase